jgi:hypothetical protein
MKSLVGARAAAMAVTLCLAIAAGATAWASGSVDPSGNSDNLYQLGKAVLAQKVTCDTCPYKGRPANAADAKMLIGEFGGADLTDRERQAVVAYIKRRYRI